ncbi:hypothetical protein GHL01_00460 [Sinorhizobium meliloti]|uniref:hypothetical protein n=1 Tax=Rhizobium meliloti TaxID=382 RepID=UPI001297CB59|nr:hypothetical protein [Sinorhizobium meliloti]MQV12217.1 hypothetical protein [Sinorhizobium meliloti]
MAAITIDIDTDLGTLDADLRRAGKMALRGLSDGLRDGHRQYLRDNLDNPMPFSENSLYVIGTPSATPELLVGIKDQQAEYLQYAYLGGQRDNALTPTLDANLDSHGNMPCGYTRAVAAADGFWMTTAKGIRGLFADNGAGGLRAVALMLDTEYDQRLDFEDEIEGIVSEALPAATKKAFGQVFGGSGK